MQPLSVYVLTYNSEKYLQRVLASIAPIADELIVVDSGSTDSTKSIVDTFSNAQFFYNPFVNYVQQREHAASLCTHSMILFVDSDEVADETLIANITEIKRTGFTCNAYSFARVWFAFHKPVHAVFPVVSPDLPVRLYNKTKVSFKNSAIVHESPSGYSTLATLKGAIHHYTFETQQEISEKLRRYTDIGAQELVRNNKKITLLKTYILPIVIAVKFYILHKGILDGIVGIQLAIYAYRFEKLKFIKAKKLLSA